MLNTDNAAQVYAQYWQCCSTLCSILTMLLNSILNTNYAAQLYALYRLCCSILCSIPTMLLNSMHNTDYAAQLYAQYQLCCSTLCSIPTIANWNPLEGFFFSIYKSKCFGSGRNLLVEKGYICTQPKTYLFFTFKPKFVWYNFLMTIMNNRCKFQRNLAVGRMLKKCRGRIGAIKPQFAPL